MFKELNTLKIFLESPTREFNVREVARLLEIAPATASSQLKYFVKKGILDERKERMLNLYKSNLDSDLYKDIKKFYIIRKIKDSLLIDELDKFYLKPTILLFGSSSYGNDIEDSDIDLLILSEKTSEFPNIKKYEKIINRKLQLFIVKDIKELKNEYLINNMLNGTIIQGEIKWT